LTFDIALLLLLSAFFRLWQIGAIPPGLFGDEATDGLAPLIRAEIWRTIRLVREAGIATLVVDKTVSEVAAVADRVVVLVKGEVAFEGHPGKLTGNAELMRQHLGV
jgi:branched-chain amino acid transport system ATP-binding protein